MAKRVLLVPDYFSTKHSGSMAARKLVELLLCLGNDVKVFSLLPGCVHQTALPVQVVRQPAFQPIQHLQPHSEAAVAFSRVIADWQPHVVFFLGTPYTKPAPMLTIASQSGARTVFMIWVQSHYCARNQAALLTGPCKRCLGGNWLHSFAHHCAPVKSLLAGALTRPQLKHALAGLDVLMCSSRDLAEDLRHLGDIEGKINFCPLFFDARQLEDLTPSDGGYFVYYGQAIVSKGWHLLPAIIRDCPTERFVLCPPGTSTEGFLTPELASVIDNDRVRLVTGLSWGSGLGEMVAQARGIINPSIWPTTTEYTLLEGLGLAKPVIVFNTGIHAEVLQTGINAMVAPIGDISTFANHIRAVTHDGYLRDTLSLNARTLFEELTSDDVYFRALRSILG